MHNTEYVLQAKLTKRNKKSNWSAELVQSFSRSGLGSGVTLFQPGMAVQPGDPVLLNDVLLQTNISGIIASYNAPLSKSVYLRTTHRLESGHLRLHNRKIPETISYTHYLPSIGLTLHLNQNNQVGINLDIKNRLPQAYNLADGYLFASAGNIVKGNDQMQTGISRTVSLSYSYTEMMKRKMFFILSAYCSREPVLYLGDIAPSVFYTLRNTDIVNKDLSVMAINAMVSKYVRGIKSQVGIETMINGFNNYYSSNHIPGTISLSGISSTIRCKTLVTNNLITNISARITSMRQDIDKTLPTRRSNHSNTFTGSTELVYKMNSKWTCSVRHQYIHQRQSDKDYSLHMGEFAIRYMAVKDRLNITLSGNNLLTGNRFNSVTFTQFSINTQSIDLVRPYLMVQASLEL
jgi:hypothetical protein